VVLVRAADLAGDADQDLAAFSNASRQPAIIEEADVPADVREVLLRATRLKGPLLSVPFASGASEV
jgi:hypothetical protein